MWEKSRVSKKRGHSVYADHPDIRSGSQRRWLLVTLFDENPCKSVSVPSGAHDNITESNAVGIYIITTNKHGRKLMAKWSKILL